MKYNFSNLLNEIIKDYEDFEILDDGRSDYLYLKYGEKSWKFYPSTLHYKDFIETKEFDVEQVKKYKSALFKSLNLNPKPKESHKKNQTKKEIDEIINLNKTQLKQQLYEIIKETFTEFVMSHEFKAVFQEALDKGVRKKILRDTKAEWIKGDKAAAKLLGTNVKIMAYRRRTGFYVEGIVWKKANYKLTSGTILWNKNALLKEMDY